MASKGARRSIRQQMLAKGEVAQSIPYLQQAIAQYPEHYMAYYDLGVAHFRLAHQADAEQAFQKANRPDQRKIRAAAVRSGRDPGARRPNFCRRKHSCSARSIWSLGQKSANTIWVGRNLVWIA